MSEQWVYRFDEGDASMKDLLGGKGANLAEMARMELPVPPGFIITTRACQAYSSTGKLPEDLMNQVRAGLADLEKATGKRLGDPTAPLLLSVRSGARFSMPGMMDTILNLGLNHDTLAGLITATGDERFGHDANRRFIMMFSDVVLGVPKARFEQILEAQKVKVGAHADVDLGAAELGAVARESLALVLTETANGFPGQPEHQLEAAIEAVFKSWNNERAVVYRRRERISDDLGTAVTVQAMVFGNLGADSGSGVAFTRDPATGERVLYGEYLMNAQGEDVVAGVRTPLPIAQLQVDNPTIYKEFRDIADRLERRYCDMMDLEFTIERGRLYVLQCRVGKRTGTAAVRIAVEMVDEGVIDQTEAVRRVQPDHIDQLLHPRIDEAAVLAHRWAPIASGIAASPGAAVGQLVFDADAAEAAGKVARPVLLVREETSPDDVHGMLGSRGILTARGGKTSHAAVVARGFGVPCVVGCDALHVDANARTLTVGGRVFHEGDWLTLDGTTGRVFGEKLALIAPEVGGGFGRLMGWCDALRALQVRANADNPRDARQAVAFGAEGIGLCRTEHMFFETDRLPIVRALILAADEDTRRAALMKLEAVQQFDFEGIFEAMAGRPVTIRLLDPPLHEFLPPHDELLQQVTELRLAQHMLAGRSLGGVLAEKEALLAAVNDMREQNPMLGLRGVRLSLVLPGIAEMQTRAIVQAALKVRHRGVPVSPEIMVPLVGHPEELARVRAVVERVVAEVLAEADAPDAFPVHVGTMIEVPRAALQAGPIAKYADFFSFGTNDLTQMTYGLSRDDAGRFLKQYVADKILPDDPFETLDTLGVGRLMQLAVTEGRAARPGLPCGICGEHGGDPRSIAFCHTLGLNYVSCSPFRVPLARLAAAQAALAGPHGSLLAASPRD